MDKLGCHCCECNGELIECIGGKDLYVSGDIPGDEMRIGRLHIHICNKCNYVDHHSAWFS